MYSTDRDGTNYIPCPAKCGKTFKGHEEMLQQVKHYATPSNNRMNDILHGILIQMHTLKICLVCGVKFDNFDSRDLFKHNSAIHQRIGDISTIQGFVTVVRKYANVGVLTTPTMQAYRSKVLSLAFQYLEERVWEGALYHLFGNFMGYRNPPMTQDQFKALVLTNSEEYLPEHPHVFLSNQRYDKNIHQGILTEVEWQMLLQRIRGHYLMGEI